MINVDLLRSLWVAKGLKQDDVAKIAGVTPKTFSLKLKKGVLGSDEIDNLVAGLDIKDPMPVFFAQLVT